MALWCEMPLLERSLLVMTLVVEFYELCDLDKKRLKFLLLHFMERPHFQGSYCYWIP
jgi:hypothetical protein